MLSILVAAFLLQLSACGAGDPCPPKSDLAGCICTRTTLQSNTTLQRPRRETSLAVTPSQPQQSELNDSSYTVVECKVPKTLQAMEEIVANALHRKLIDKLVVENVPAKKDHTLARLPSGWLKNVRVKHFEVRHSLMSGDFIWNGNPFEGQSQSLLWFSATKCQLTGSLTFDIAGTVNSKGLNTLPHIQGVDLSNNRLTVLSGTAFRYPPSNLSTVIVSKNSLQLIEGGAFQYAPLLRYVDLSHNLLESLTRAIFASPARLLQHIDLSWNLLTFLPVDFFNNMPALKTVNISNNFLYSMPEKPWSVAWRQLTVIDVTNNFIDCDCNLLWLLPIISPPKANVTTTPVPTPLPGQTVLGKCSRNFQPKLFFAQYDLVTLTRDRLMC